MIETYIPLVGSVKPDDKSPYPEVTRPAPRPVYVMEEYFDYETDDQGWEVAAVTDIERLASEWVAERPGTRRYEEHDLEEPRLESLGLSGL